MVRYSSFYSVLYGTCFEPLGAIEVEIRNPCSKEKSNIPILNTKILQIWKLNKIHTVIPNSENTEKYMKKEIPNFMLQF